MDMQVKPPPARPMTARSFEPVARWQHALPPLPYAADALEPVISSHTLRTHHSRHNRSYIDELNRLTAGSIFAIMSLEQLILATARRGERAPLFDNATQAWNHDFYWNSLRPAGGGVPPLSLQGPIRDAFGDCAGLKQELGRAAAQQFGSGWLWLALEGQRLVIGTTPNTDTVLTGHLVPLLAFDLWEHAYYLDYACGRAQHLAAVFDQLINWDFAAANLLHA
jgi:Fe-Mn family superoxide dismutase